MRYLLGSDFYKALGKKFDSKLVMEIYTLHKIKTHVHWVDGKNLDNHCWKYTMQLGWDPETTLVYYTPLPGKNDKATLCLFIENMTKEELINVFLKTAKMKAFL